MADSKTPDLSGMIELIQKNPELLKTAMGLLSSVSEKKEEKPSLDMTALSNLMPTVTGESSGKKEGLDRRAALLSALKPYLSPERREVIDRMMSFSRVGDLIKTFNKE